MTEIVERNISNCNLYDDFFYKILTDCVHPTDSDLEEHVNELANQELLCDYFKMIAIADSTTSPDGYTNTSIIKNDGRISLAYENLKNIPQKIAESFSNEIKFLDLSFNNFKNLSFLSFFKGLHTLILDKNIELDESTFPYLPHLDILWLNNCSITNIPKWIYRIQLQCPNLRQLSLIGNPGAKTLITGATLTEEADYRLFVVETIKTLKYLDGIPVISTQYILPNHTDATDEMQKKSVQIVKGKIPSTSSAKGYNYRRNNNKKDNKSNIQRKIISANSFKDLFQFSSRRKKHYPTSSTS